MNTAVVEQGGLRDRTLSSAAARIAASERFISHFLYGFEAMPFGAFVLVEGHGELFVAHSGRLLNVSAAVQSRGSSTILILGRIPQRQAEFTAEKIVAFLASDLRESKGGAVAFVRLKSSPKGGAIMPGNIFYIIGVVVVVLFILGYLGLR